METNNLNHTNNEYDYIIAHPSYEVNQIFMSLGVRETVTTTIKWKIRIFISYREKIYPYRKKAYSNTKIRQSYFMNKIKCS